MLRHDLPPTPPSGDPATLDPEWWERAAQRRTAWMRAHPGATRALRVATWAGAVLVVVLLVVSPTFRAGFRSFLPCWLLLVAWFLLARTKTLRWATVARLFALGIPLAAVIAFVSFAFAAAFGLEVSDDGAGVGIASAVEELLKLVPVAVVCIVAPGRVRRFAAVDWVVLGVGSGMAFQAFEDSLRRVLIGNRAGSWWWGLFQPADPWAEETSGFPQYGWSLLAGWSDNGVAFYAGHHVLTGVVVAGIGLAVHLRARPGWLRWGRWLLPLGLWFAAVVAHAAYNASAYSSAFADGGTDFPVVLRAVWVVIGRGRALGPVLVALFLLALVVDARRLRAREAAVPAHPAGRWPGWSDRWARRVAEAIDVPPASHPRVLAVVGGVRRLAMGVAFLAGAVVRDVRVVLAAFGDDPGRPRRAGRWTAAVALTRDRREAVAPVGDVAARHSLRRNALVVSAAGLVVSAGIAAWLATSIGTSLTIEGVWLAGLLDSLADWWSSRSLGEQLLLTVGLAALVVLSGGSFGLALGVAGGASWFAEHGKGAADFLRNPAGAARSFVTDLTPQQALAYAAELLLQRLVPAGVGGGAGRVVRRRIDEVLDDPAAFRRQLADDLRSDRGSFRVGPDPWRDPARRAAWNDRWKARPTRPGRSPSIDNTPEGRPAVIRQSHDADMVRSLQRENESADVLAEHGFRVEQNPVTPEITNPDYRIEGQIWDNYAPSTSRARNIWQLVHTEKVSRGQTSRIVLNLDDSGVDLGELRTQFADWEMPGLEEVLVVRGGDVIPLYP